MKNVFLREGELGVIARLWLAIRFGYKAFKTMRGWHIQKGDVIHVTYKMEVN